MNTNILKDIFVPYEIAEKLKEIGFKESCLAGYEKRHKRVMIESVTFTRYNFEEDLYIRDFNKRDTMLSAPTFEQVFEWFIDRKYFIDIVYDEHSKKYCTAIKHKDKLNVFRGYKTYIEAREELILELIKIYKENETQDI